MNADTRRRQKSIREARRIELCVVGLVLSALSVFSCRPHAPKVADPRSPEEKRWDAAHALENEDAFDAALRGYRDLCEQAPPYIRGCFDRARLLFETHTPEKARLEALQTVRRFSESGLAPSLIKRIARSYQDTEETVAGIAALTDTAKMLSESESRDTAWYEAARLARVSGDTPVEEKLLIHLATTHGRWESQLWDNAVMRLSEICRESGRTDEELRWLECLIEAEESSRLIGSYTSPFHDDALHRSAEIYFERGAYKTAYKRFLNLADRKESRLADEGLLGAARAAAALGRVSKACRLLAAAAGADGTAKREALREAESYHCRE